MGNYPSSFKISKTETKKSSNDLTHVTQVRGAWCEPTKARAFTTRSIIIGKGAGLAHG